MIHGIQPSAPPPPDDDPTRELRGGDLATPTSGYVESRHKLLADIAEAGEPDTGGDVLGEHGERVLAGLRALGAHNPAKVLAKAGDLVQEQGIPTGDAIRAAAHGDEKSIAEATRLYEAAYAGVTVADHEAAPAGLRAELLRKAPTAEPHALPIPSSVEEPGADL